VKVARAHARVSDARRDFHHKLSTRIIRDSQAVYMEDLSVRGAGADAAGEVGGRRRLVGVRGDA
jgi:transposase